jgi:phosphatidylglycerophosphatase A
VTRRGGGAARAIATVGYVGLAPVAPGTVASAAALPLGYLLHWAGGFPLLAAATVAAALLGWWAIRVEIEGRVDKDPQEVVIDEVVGQWIALMPLSAGLWWMGAPAHVFPWPGWVGAFVMFRFFDVVKPGPIGWADRRGGAMGVMLDDILAGIAAALVVAAAAAVAHGVLM